MDSEFDVITPLKINKSFSLPYSLTINVVNALLSRVCKKSHMLYLKNRKGYRHVLGTTLSGMPNFIFNFNTHMGLKINAF